MIVLSLRAKNRKNSLSFVKIGENSNMGKHPNPFLKKNQSVKKVRLLKVQSIKRNLLNCKTPSDEAKD